MSLRAPQHWEDSLCPHAYLSNATLSFSTIVLSCSVQLIAAPPKYAVETRGNMHSGKIQFFIARDSQLSRPMNSGGTRPAPQRLWPASVYQIHQLFTGLQTVTEIIR
jgi:hypothetical protein